MGINDIYFRIHTDFDDLHTFIDKVEKCFVPRICNNMIMHTVQSHRQIRETLPNALQFIDTWKIKQFDEFIE